MVHKKSKFEAKFRKSLKQKEQHWLNDADDDEELLPNRNCIIPKKLNVLKSVLKA